MAQFVLSASLTSDIPNAFSLCWKLRSIFSIPETALIFMCSLYDRLQSYAFHGKKLQLFFIAGADFYLSFKSFLNCF